MNNPGTWWSVSETLPDELSSEACEVIRKATAPARHAWRCAQAKVAAYTAAEKCIVEGGDTSDVGNQSWLKPDGDGEGSQVVSLRRDIEVAGAFLALVDHVGIGGQMGITGEKTDRLPVFSHLGKGRKQATDGGAWDGAIESIYSTRSTEGTYPLDGLVLSPDDESYPPKSLDLHNREGLALVSGVRCNAIPPDWRVAIAKRAILVLHGTISGTSAVLDHDDLRRPNFDRLLQWPDYLWPGDLPENNMSCWKKEDEMIAWGKVLQAAEEEMRQPMGELIDGMRRDLDSLGLCEDYLASGVGGDHNSERFEIIRDRFSWGDPVHYNPVETVQSTADRLRLTIDEARDRVRGYYKGQEALDAFDCERAEDASA